MITEIVIRLIKLCLNRVPSSTDEADSPVRSCGGRVKKNVKRCDLFISDDDHVLARIARHAAARAGAPLQATCIVEGLGSSMGCVGEVRMRGAQVTCKLIEGIVPNEDAWGDTERTVIRVELLDGSASLRSVALSKNFLKVTEQ
jgi:hypothetical protein